MFSEERLCLQRCVQNCIDVAEHNFDAPAFICLSYRSKVEITFGTSIFYQMGSLNEFT